MTGAPEGRVAAPAAAPRGNGSPTKFKRLAENPAGESLVVASLDRSRTTRQGARRIPDIGNLDDCDWANTCF